MGEVSEGAVVAPSEDSHSALITASVASRVEAVPSMSRGRARGSVSAAATAASIRSPARIAAASWCCWPS